MTDFLPILASETSVDAPVTASLMGRLSDNPKAIAEGAPGAPKIMADAVQLLLDDQPLSDVAGGIAGLSARLSWVWVDFGFRYPATGTTWSVSVEARFKLGAAAYGAWVTVVGAVPVAAGAICMLTGGLWVRPNTGAWRCTLGGNFGTGTPFDAVQMRLVTTGASPPAVAGGRMIFVGISSLA